MEGFKGLGFAGLRFFEFGGLRGLGFSRFWGLGGVQGFRVWGCSVQCLWMLLEGFRVSGLTGGRDEG